MRSGIASTIISSSGQVNAGVIENSDLAADAVKDNVVDAAAAIAASKVDFASVNQHVIPDANDTRHLGSAAKYWLRGYVKNLFATNCDTDFRPNTDDTLDLGAAVRNWKDIYVNEVKGAAAGQIMVNGLLGG